MEALITTHGVLSRALNVVSGKGTGQGVVVKQIPKPSIKDHEILVKVHAVALNPIDYLCIDLLATRDSIAGCDFAGSCRFVHGGFDNERGSFAQYMKTEGDLAWRIPHGMTDEDASTYGTPVVTAQLALHSRLGVPWEAGAPTKGTILIYSGSTAVGLAAIQFAKKAGYTVVTTASPHSFELVKRYGAGSVFDYRSPAAISSIIREHPNITQALDCISDAISTDFCAQVLKANGGKVVTLKTDGKSKVPNVKIDLFLVFTAFGKHFQWLPPIGPSFPVIPSDRGALVQFYAALPLLVHDVKPPPVRVLGRGFEKIIAGLDELREGKVSGQKLVVKLV
ncbi:putative ToxD-like zinc binding oxidoreductase [Amylocarpus encephaloides]|uniref:ToxD-like zinc binding oxidoreductase n=1 Tax=Amylocarpus encephaloides TaxID=45428 RepID=A0A9P7YFA2_9HELO|nr:putative ToxD-like zinc binding oxidoreductase [Amylocarpus encephaloides]